MKLLHVALYDRYSPALGQLIVVEHLEHTLVPKVLPFCGFLLDGLLIGEGEVSVIAEVEVVLEYVFSDLLQYFLVF